MLEKLLATIKRYHLFSAKDKVLVAVSGGPDSVALLYGLWQLKDVLDIELYAAHLNHMLRAEAAEDAAFVRNLAWKLKIPLTVDEINIPELMGVKSNASPETLAREVRYNFLYLTAGKYACGKIALGHHADDQVETVLANLIHGTGLRGLGGMRLRHGRLIRPLLKIRREEIMDYLGEQKLKWREDTSNYEPLYQRNLLRLEIIPSLQQLNRRFPDAVVNMSEILREEERYLDNLADSAFKKVLLPQQKLTLDLEALQKMDVVLVRRVLRKAYQQAAGSGRAFSFSHAERLRELAFRGKGRMILPLKIEARAAKGQLSLRPLAKEENTRTAYSVVLPIPGRVVLEDGSVITAVLADVPENPRHIKNEEAFLDLDKVKEPLVVRNRRPGDYFYPLGMKGKKKVKKFFIDAGIRPELREKIPLVECRGKIIWICGQRIDERYKITAETKKALYLKYSSAAK